MEGDRTAQSVLLLPLNIARQENYTCNISKASGRMQVLKTCKLIFKTCGMNELWITESSRGPCRHSERSERKRHSLEGDLILFCGDLRETLFVIPKSTPADEIHACLKRRKINLKQNMRVHVGDENT